MMKALFAGSTGMKAQERQLHTISNNLANVNTEGFKKNRNNFQDLLYTQERIAGAHTSATTILPNGLQQGHGVKHASTEKIFSQGNLSHTAVELDVSIDGDGFFQVKRPNGDIAYTRNGAWKRDIDGRIVNADGYPMEPEIIIPQEAIKIMIGDSGIVEVFFDGEIYPQQIGQVEVAQFINPSGLNSLGKNIFSQSAASGEPIISQPGEQGAGMLNQGFLELSNVSLVEEMVNMINAQRAYEANSKSILTSDNMLETSVNLVR